MGLSYQDLLSKLEAVIEDKFNNKFNDLRAELEALKNTNSLLLKINKSLIEENKLLRSSTANSPSADDDRDLDQGESEIESTCELAVTAATKNASASFPASTKIHVDVLILSDSIYRHVGSVCPKERDRRGLPVKSTFQLGGLEFLKFVYPGARCENLLSAVAELHQTYSFDQVIVSVGTNYTHQDSVHMPSVVAEDICDFLVAIADFLDCGVSFSCILPQRDLGVTSYINMVNSQVAVFCGANQLGLLQCLRFKRVRGKIDTSLFANDGVHVSFTGVAALLHTVIDHIKYNVVRMS